MTLRLGDLATCFEGVIPSILATAAPDGTPNISYLSHVEYVDDGHIALSNQFFSKTAANLRANPVAALLVVDALTGEQFRLDVRYERSLDSGPLFDSIAMQLHAASAQIGMGDVMQLRAVDIFAVTAIRAVPSPTGRTGTVTAGSAHLAAVAAVLARLAGATEIGAVIDTLLDGVRDQLHHRNAMVLLADPHAERLVTIGSRGYPVSGAGAEVPLGEGVIGSAAAERRPVRVSDMSRIRRFGAAIRASAEDEGRTRTIALPGMADAMSQVALPMIAHGVLRGVLFVESPRRLAFTREDEAALSAVALAGAAAIALAEGEAREGSGADPGTRGGEEASGRPFRVVHHPFDDSVFLDGDYLIKGVAGRLLVHLLRLHLREGRTEFTNREIRLSQDLRLPDFKDNLETRLLLLRRRLEDKAAPVQIVRTGRGRIRLDLAGPPRLPGEAP